MKSVGDFSMGHAGTLVEIDDGGLSVGAELALGGAGRITGLQLMSATQMLAALAAMAAMNVELAEDRLAWDIGLELRIEMILDDRSAARGALIGQGRLVGFIDPFGWRRLAMSVTAMQISLFAARLFGPLLGLTFGERGGLPFGGAFGFIKTLLEIAIGFLKLFDGLIAQGELFAKMLQLKENLLVGKCVHADLASDKPCQLSRIMGFFTLASKMALNNHE
jgi:hypothetical protein